MITLAICTYQREKLLKKCLESIYNNVTQYDFYVLVVDNCSTDKTNLVCNNYAAKYRNFRYVREIKQGLSYARNCAIEKTETNWIFFIDDDGRLPDNFINRLYYGILIDSVDVLGGTYIPYFDIDPPSWLPNSFGKKELLRTDFGEVKNGFLAGGVMGFKIASIGNIRFNTELGMNASSIGYGEEVLFQTELRNLGCKIYFDPHLIMEHHVAPNKLSRRWHLKASFAFGRDSWKAFDKNLTYRDLVYLIRELLLNKLFVIRSFYDMKKAFILLGKLYGAMRLLLKG